MSATKTNRLKLNLEAESWPSIEDYDHEGVIEWIQDGQDAIEECLNLLRGSSRVRRELALSALQLAIQCLQCSEEELEI